MPVSYTHLGHQDLPEVSAHRLPEHLVRHRHQAGLSAAGRSGYRQYVAGDLRRCGRHGPGSAQRHPCPLCEESVSLSLTGVCFP